jgi:hypothetical protein
MEVIKIGVYSFNAEFLKDKTMKEAREFFSKIPQKIVDEAWKIVNPKPPLRAKKKIG